MAKKIQIRFTRRSVEYAIVIHHGGLSYVGRWAHKCVGKSARKVAVVSNSKVFKLYGEQTESSLRDAGFELSRYLMKDGEQYKTLRSAESALGALANAGLERGDAVIALGGGVVGDLAGFAASVYLRGIALLQVPTTLLAMVDSSVGGKTGVNTVFGKNLIGSFHQPGGVLIDPALLATLPHRESTAGFCEIVKQSALSGPSLLQLTDDFLTKFGPHAFNKSADDNGFKEEIEALIALHVAYKAKIVAGDEREYTVVAGTHSRKILNFGHTLAHALEKATNYRKLRHGEAVGYGILYAAEVSKALDLCDEKDVKLLYDVVHRVGRLPSLAGIDPKRVIDEFRFDKKNLAGSLQMVLLRGIGEPVIVGDQDIPPSVLRKVLKNCLKKWV